MDERRSATPARGRGRTRSCSWKPRQHVRAPWQYRTQRKGIIAAFLLDVRDTTGKRPHCYFGWTQGNPIAYIMRFILFGEGDTAPVTHEVLREAEPDLGRRPLIHVGGG